MLSQHLRFIFAPSSSNQNELTSLSDCGFPEPGVVRVMKNTDGASTTADRVIHLKKEVPGVDAKKIS